MKNIIKAYVNDKKREIDVEVTIVAGTITEIRCVSPISNYESIDCLELPSVCQFASGKTEKVYALGQDIFLHSKSDLKRGKKIGTAANSIKKLILPPGVFIVNEKALKYVNVKTVVWPASCPVIPNECFEGSSIEEIQGIENVTNIRISAFERCYHLKKLKWPEKVKSVPSRCFLNCVELVSVEGLENVTEIESYAFYACTKLPTFNWPENCKTIPVACFMGCRNLKDVNIHSSINAIFREAFKETQVKGLDLSQSISCDIQDESVLNSMKNQMPFYQVL